MPLKERTSSRTATTPGMFRHSPGCQSHPALLLPVWMALYTSGMQPGEPLTLPIAAIKAASWRWPGRLMARCWLLVGKMERCKFGDQDRKQPEIERQSVLRRLRHIFKPAVRSRKQFQGTRPVITKDVSFATVPALPRSGEAGLLPISSIPGMEYGGCRRKASERKRRRKRDTLQAKAMASACFKDSGFWRWLHREIALSWMLPFPTLGGKANRGNRLHLGGHA